MDRINLLRQEMKKTGIDCCLVPTSDYHGSEYICEAFEGRRFLSGFTGSAGTLLVTADEAGLWTDGRYFVQAEKELGGSGITLYRMGEPGVPTINKYLIKVLSKGQTLTFDGRMVGASSGKKMVKELEANEVKTVYDCDLLSNIWLDRPALPAEKIWHLSIDWSGQSTSDKLAVVRKKLAERNVFALVLNSLDDIMWLFNIRGGDIPENPIALAYAYITGNEAILFVQKKALSTGLLEILTKANVKVAEYHDFYGWLLDLHLDKNQQILMDANKCNYYIYTVLKQKAKPILDISPTTTLKAVKNQTELKHIKEVYRKDSAVVIKFIKWLKENKDKITEIDAAKKIDDLRSEVAGFLDISFGTIAAYGANAAMMHYQATKEHNAVIGHKGLFLIDSGGQYYGGTTDVTRTVVMGEISDDIKRYFTSVVRGMLNLSNLIFLHGCTGRSIDIIARKPLWDIKSDYKCGTGHGIGYMLSVHEGPQNIRMPYQKETTETVLEAGMLVSNEPGVYKAGEYGIRIENILAVKEESVNEDGKFLKFETLTLVPIDLEAIDTTQLSAEDKKQLNDYHLMVYDIMCEYVDEDEKDWLKNATRPL